MGDQSLSREIMPGTSSSNSGQEQRDSHRQVYFYCRTLDQHSGKWPFVP